MNYKSYADLSSDIKKNLYKLQNKEFDLVVGIPRSGMIPAYMIALGLNINCTDLLSFINNANIIKGNTRKTKKEIYQTWDAENILIVDDSIASGGSMRSSGEKIPDDYTGKVTTLAIYSSQRKRNDVNIFLEHVSFPRVFEWNIFHHAVLSRSCVDIDGVLCHDPTEEQNDDGEKYINFLLNTDPYILPTVKIHSLVTNRLEKYRPQTDEWLRKHGVEFDNLIMLNVASKEERIRLRLHSKHKADYYIKSKLPFFIESDTNQAINISLMSGKPVYCVKDNVVYEPGMINKICKNPTSIFTGIKRQAQYLPRPIKNIIRPLYKGIRQIITGK